MAHCISHDLGGLFPSEDFGAPSIEMKNKGRDIKIVGNARKRSAMQMPSTRTWVYDEDGIIGTLAATDYKEPRLVCIHGRVTGYKMMPNGTIRGLQKKTGSVSEEYFQSVDDVCGTIMTVIRPNITYIHNDERFIRRLTERECFRIMDVDDESIDKIQAAGVSKSQQMRMAGNSIVVACLYHIFKNLFITKNDNIPKQMTINDLLKGNEIQSDIKRKND